MSLVFIDNGGTGREHFINLADSLKRGVFPVILSPWKMIPIWWVVDS